jgi:N-acetylglucosamine-6-phosphate deacetylase
MTRTAYVNCDIYTGDGFTASKALLVDADRIVGLVDSDDLPSGCDVVDLGGLNLAPGFIDLQVNGGGIQAIVAGHRRFGVTSLLPTFITGAVKEMKRASDAVADVMRSEASGVLGIHFEGPLLNPKKAGVHDAAYITEAIGPELNDLYDPRNTGTMLVTLAPERIDVDSLQKLKDRGVRLACGHSEANTTVVEAARLRGLTLGTHVFNAMAPMTSRDAGTVGALLSNDHLYCSFIADGFHVDFDVLKVAICAKPRGKAFLVTDAMPPVGGKLREYTLGPYEVTLTDEGRAETQDGVLAGSALDMATAVRNVVQKIGLPKDEALRMASTYPAEYLGVADRLGYIRPGYSADLVVFDNEIRVARVIVGGVSELAP